jgi:FtsP/CotA-like multicopper oxidase with cupredoxin domain
MLPSASIVSRRRVLAGAGAVVTCFSFRSGAQTPADLTPDGFRLLRARAGSLRRAPAGEAGAISVWGFEGAVPGPLLRVARGEELRLRLVNELSDPAAIHWHGVRVPNLMDGAPGLTQTEVAPGAGFDYRFRPPDAGTFWYHAPWSTAAASGRRLYGALIVEEADPAEVDREHVLVFDEWPFVSPEEPSRTAASFRILTNGTPAPDLAVRANERLRLRLINAATARVVALRVDRHRPCLPPARPAR